MNSSERGGGKLPGKTKYAGRRREITRRSGFTVNKVTKGGEFRRLHQKSYVLNPGEIIEILFHMQGHKAGDLLGYGMWFWCTNGIELSISGGPSKRTFTEYDHQSWNKLGSIWKVPTADPTEIRIILIAHTKAQVALYNPVCGRVRHKYFDSAREALLQNMFDFAPEAIFLDGEIDAVFDVTNPKNAPIEEKTLIVKSCNRCGRFLPINFPNERDQLSFTNHCNAEHLRPCKHSTFGRLRNVDDETDVLKLDYGFQLECRFCKKFEVNAAHNPQRTSAQMKEDGARRRALEFLLDALYGGSPQLRYRLEHNAELTEYIWERFGHACFNCNVELKTSRKMHLDHTRPLALLWPLDGTATALCKSCNTLKRDRSPVNFYTTEKLSKLSKITGIPITDLSSDKPNEEAIELLLSRLDWFYDDFLARPEMAKEHDGKIVGELVVKALQKAISRSPRHRHVNLQQEYEHRRT